MYVCMHACMYVCMHVCIYVCVRACMYVRTCVCVCVYVYIYIYIYTHIHAHTYLLAALVINGFLVIANGSRVSRGCAYNLSRDNLSLPSPEGGSQKGDPTPNTSLKHYI